MGRQARVAGAKSRNCIQLGIGEPGRVVAHFGEAHFDKLGEMPGIDRRYTPFIAVWNHALPDNPRKWKRKKPKGTNVKRIKPIRAGTKPVAYERASEFVLAMSPAPAMVMTALFYSGNRTPKTRARANKNRPG